MADLKIVISALNKASGDLNKLKTEISGVKGSAKEATTATGGLGSSLSSMMGTAALVTGAVVAVGAAMKQVYDTAKEGAELEYAADKFDRLSTSIGATSDALLGDLRTATSGMRSDAELMASATDFMALGFAKSSDEVVRLTTVAGALNMNMNQLVLTLANQTTMRFDQLGVSVDGFDAKVAKLKETGMSASEAFQEAFLQQAEEQIGKVGSAADSAVAPIQKMETAFKNLGDAIKLTTADALDGLAPVLTSLADHMTENVRVGQQWKDVIDGLREAKDNDLITGREYNAMMRDLGVHSGMGAATTEQLAKATRYLAIATGEGLDSTQSWADANYESAAGMAAAQAAAESGTTSIQAVADATNNADMAMRGYTESLLFKIASEGLSSEAALALAYAMGLVDKNTVAATKQTDIYKQMLDSGKITQAQYNRLIADLGDKIDNLPEGKTLTVETDTTEIKAKLDELEMRQFKPKTLTVNLAFNGGVENYLPSHGMTNAVGGSVNRGNPYTWQEYGYRGEVFIPSQNGYVLSRAEAERALSRALVDGSSGGGVDSKAIASAVASAVSGALSVNRQQPAYSGPSTADFARAVRDALLMARAV